MATAAPGQCPACGYANSSAALFCASCGTPIACSACHAPLSPDSAFCTNCGRASARRPDASRIDLAPGRPIERRVEQTQHLRIFVQTGSFADQQSGAVAQRLESLIAAASKLLGTPEPEGQISVYLAEVLQDPAQPGRALTAGSYAVPDRREVWSIYRSDAPGADLERTFVRLLIVIHTGHDPAAAPFLLDGLVGVLGQALGFFPPQEQLSQMLAGALASGMQISVRPLLNGPTEETAQLYPVVSASFAGYIISERGADTFLKLIGDYLPANPDAAAKQATGQSFEGLEKRWLQAIRKYAPSAAGIGKFLRSSFVYLRPYRTKQLEIIIYILFGIAFSQLLPHAQRYLIDNALTTKKDSRLLFFMLGTGLVLFFIMGAASLRQNYLSAQVGEGVLRDLRQKMFVRLQELSASFYSSTGTGDILSRMSNDLFAVEFALTGAMLQGFVLVLTFFASLASLLYIDWKLTIIALVVLPFFYLITRLLGPPASRASRDRQERLGLITGTLQENIAAQPVVRAYGLKENFIREWLQQTAGLFRSAIRLTFLSSLFGLSASLLTTLIQVLAFGIGGYLVIQGQLSLGALVAFLSLLGGLIAPAQNLSGVAQALQQASGAMDRVNELLNATPAIADKPDAITMAPLQQGISFDHVTFSYTGAEPQLNDLSFTIPAGASVAFVGPSGSGKSTVTNLIMRFYDAGSGAVLMDGVDVRDISLDSLRRQISIVFQESFLFNRSIRENIRFGREDATDAEVEEAAKAAEVHEFILSLPQGYDTVTGERGANLSGGQRQRLSIARAILRNPSILVLDEATSALDPRTENAINHTLASLSKGRTTISVTHRLASAATADLIFVLDRGHLVEQGTHQQLLAAEGLYARLYEEQSGAVPGGVLAMALELEYLRRVPIFTTLDSDLLSSIASRLTTERFELGADVVTAGNIGDKLYIVVAGEADVLARDKTGNERALALLRPGDYFGEIALMYDVPRTATVRARTPLTVHTLGRTEFLAMLEMVPGMRQTIEQNIADREAAHMGGRAPAAGSAADAGMVPLPRPASVNGDGGMLVEGAEQGTASMFSAPWVKRRPRLVVVEGENPGRSYVLNELFTGLGRHPGNDIVLTDRRVSGYHARIERDAAGRFSIIDSGSSNGTRVQEQMITAPAELHDGDLLTLGRTRLRFEQGS